MLGVRDEGVQEPKLANTTFSFSQDGTVSLSAGREIETLGGALVSEVKTSAGLRTLRVLNPTGSTQMS
jgi:hypothetical protein